MKTRFPFSDLHSFKDYVVFVQTYLPDKFRPREGAGPEEQWTIDLAFEGLNYGIDLAIKEKGERVELIECRALVDEAHIQYDQGRSRDGFFTLERVRKLLRKIRSK